MACRFPSTEYHRLKYILELVRDAYHADRCWLLYPCDPEADKYIIPLETHTDNYPGVSQLKNYQQAHPILQQICKATSQTNNPVVFDISASESELQKSYLKFNIKAQLACKIEIKTPRNEHWALGLHHCEHEHQWSHAEKELLAKITRLIQPQLETLLDITSMLNNMASTTEVIDNSPMAQVIYNMDRRIVFANEKYLQLNERSLDEVINTTSRQYFSKKDLIKYDNFFDTILSTGKAVVSAPKKRGDGKLVFIENTGSLIRFLGKKHYLLACKDTTEETETLNALETSLEIQQAIMETSDDGIVVEDVNRKVITINQNFFDYFSIPSSHLSDIQHSTLRLVKAALPVVKNSAEIGEMVTKLAANTTNKASLYIYLNDGKILDLAAFPLFYKDAVHGRVWYFKDITEKVNSTKALQSSLDIQHAIMEATDDGMLVESVDRDVITLNKTFIDTFKIDKKLASKKGLRTLEILKSGSVNISNVKEISQLIVSLKPTADTKSTALIYLLNGSILDMSSFPLIHENSIQGRVWYFKDITEKVKLTQKLSFEATHDPLTKLMNRRGFDDELRNSIEKIKQKSEFHALLYMDLDRFKIINDSCGHGAGDVALIQISELLMKHLRSSDVLARVGGDEFCILLKNCPPDTAQKIAEKIRRYVDKFDFEWEDKVYDLGVSIGIIVLDETVMTYEEALKLADTSCYLAKEEGRNRIHFHTSADQAVLLRLQQNNIISQIQNALNTDRLVCYIQKICHVEHATKNKGCGLCNYEVLIRMLDDAGNIIPPNVFLPAAERYKLIYKIDHWVIQHAITAMATVQDKFNWFSINLSGQTIGHEFSFDIIKEAIETSGIAPHKICFEVTETAAITNPEFGLEFLNKLRELGCLVALDDFGTGLSSYEYLKKLPADILKIDGQFVKNMLDDELDFAMIKSINEIAHIMGKETIAEFVENADILNKLLEIGVDYAQGYHLDTPKPLSSLLNVASISTGRQP
ncbi:MAG: EAL domain-containing protein [Cycloclasticus sp.]|nr:EAL domain-containing protein [Cycloclasticus sp.]